MTFPNLHPALARALTARGYDVPTAVQLAVLADDVTGRDLLVSAQTGSGKTVAFGLALGSTLLAEDEAFPEAGAPLALIIAPTRELAVQVCRELTWLYGEAGARVTACVGGTEARAEARQLAAGAHIVVGTPGRLRDHLERRRLDLSGLRAVVLDEADEMLDLGFREDLEFILDAAPVARRTLLFSATLPRGIVTLAGRYQRDAARIETLRHNEQHADIDYWAHRVVPHDVENAVVNVLRYHEAPAALVFCSTRDAVNRLNARLIERGFSSVALSGELTQQERTRALQSLRNGRARVLVATDVAARGLDLPDLSLVIHAELPNDGETLLHRSGRTGRAGKKGLCVLIVPYNRRRKADAVIGAARLAVTWRAAPTPEEIYARDQERFLADAVFAAAASDDEAQLVLSLQQARTADEIALALIRMRRAKFPAAEELTADAGPPARRDRRARDDAEFGDRPHRERKPRRDDRPEQTGERPRRERHDTRPMVWFQINIGRDQKAEPRWLLPLLCRAGGVSKAEIGAIRVEQQETRFEILAEIADQFEAHARTSKKKEGHVVRIGAGANTADVGDRTDAGPETDLKASKPPHQPTAEKWPRRKRFDDVQAADERGETVRDVAPSSDPDADKRHVPARHGKKSKPAGGGWAPRGRSGKPSHGHGGGRAGARTKTGHERPASNTKKKFKKHRAPAHAGGNV